MKKSQFTDRQIAFALQQAEGGTPVDEVCRRSVKYGEVYLRAYETVGEVRASIVRHFVFYNSRRPHSSLDRQTPDAVYYNQLPVPVTA